MTPTHIDLLAGKYRLGDCVGEGGMGSVHRAAELHAGRTVAVKILRPEWVSAAEMVDRFQQEAVAMARVHHPGVVRIIECAATPDGRPCIVMEWARGQSLSEVLAAAHPLPLRRVLALVGQVLDALGAVHAAGVAHGDLKSDNLIVERAANGGDRVKLIDFGLARLLDRPGARRAPATPGRHDVCGTPEYIAPELIQGGDASNQSDIYAVGVLLYELLSGRTPFVGGSIAEVLARQVADEPVPPSLRCPDRVIAAALDAVILRALAKRPEQRYRHAGAMQGALRSALGGVTSVSEWRCLVCEGNLDAPQVRCPRCGAEVLAAPHLEPVRTATTRVLAAGTGSHDAASPRT